MELSVTKDNEELLPFVTESPTPDSMGVLDAPPDVFKNMLKITIKIKWTDKIVYTLLRYRKTR